MRHIGITHMTFLFSSLIHAALLLFINIDMDELRDEMPDKLRVKLVYAIDHKEMPKKDITPVKKSNIQPPAHSITEEAHTQEESPIISEIKESVGLAEKPIEMAKTQDKVLISQIVAKRDDGNSPNPSISIDLSAIAERLRREIENIKGYPYIAVRRGFEGTVILFIKLDTEGSLIQSRIIKSSGYEVLDAHALSLIKRVTPFKHDANRNIEIEVPITYRLIR